MFYNLSNLVEINTRARRCGIERDVRTKVRVLPKDDGEVFFSECLLQQRWRDSEYDRHTSSSRCQCAQCARNAIPIPYVQDRIDNNDGGGKIPAVDSVLTAAPTVAPGATLLAPPITTPEEFVRHQRLNELPLLSAPSADLSQAIDHLLLPVPNAT